jgi:hypothetical protein
VTGVSDFMPTRVEELLDVLGVRPDPNVTTAVDADEPKAVGQCEKADAVVSVIIKPKPRPDMEKN